MIDTYTLKDIHVGDRVRAFHPQTMGVMHWATVVKVGRKWVHVHWHVTDVDGRILPRDIDHVHCP